MFGHLVVTISAFPHQTFLCLDRTVKQRRRFTVMPQSDWIVHLLFKSKRTNLKIKRLPQLLCSLPKQQCLENGGLKWWLYNELYTKISSIGTKLTCLNRRCVNVWTQPEISSPAIQSWLLRHRLHLGICQTLEPCWFSHFTLGKKGNILKTFNHRCPFKLSPAGARQPSFLRQPYPESKIVPPLFLLFLTNVSVFSSCLDKFPELWPPPTPRC